MTAARAPTVGCASRGPAAADGASRRWAGGRLRADEILQRHVPGMSCSAVAIADGRDAVVLGLTEQLHRGRYEWTGNVTPPRLPAAELAELDGRLRAVCAEVASRFAVRGAFGVDGIWDGRELWVLEVNPRPTASLELFERRSVRRARSRRARCQRAHIGRAGAAQVCKGETRAVRGP